MEWDLTEAIDYYRHQGAPGDQNCDNILIFLNLFKPKTRKLNVKKIIFTVIKLETGG